MVLCHSTKSVAPLLQLCGCGLCDNHLADPEFLPVAPLLLRLLELVLAVGEAGFLFGRPVCGGGGQITRRVSRRCSAGE